MVRDKGSFCLKCLLQGLLTHHCMGRSDLQGTSVGNVASVMILWSWNNKRVSQMEVGVGGRGSVGEEAGFPKVVSIMPGIYGQDHVPHILLRVLRSFNCSTIRPTDTRQCLWGFVLARTRKSSYTGFQRLTYWNYWWRHSSLQDHALNAALWCRGTVIINDAQPVRHFDQKMLHATMIELWCCQRCSESDNPLPPKTIFPLPERTTS